MLEAINQSEAMVKHDQERLRQLQLEEEKQIEAEINEHKMKEGEIRRAKLAVRAEAMEKKRQELHA